MKEEFLHYIWKFCLFNRDLITHDGEVVEVIHPGTYNTDAGPDFHNARIRIGNTVWAGNVEIHVNASDWHKHQHDNVYDNIILHVVYNNDAVIKRKNNEVISSVELNGRFDKKLYTKYQQFLNNESWISCEKQVNDVDKLIIESCLESLLIERLERKVKVIDDTLKLCNNSWEQTFYQHLARNFGLKLNVEPFELLAKSLPMIYLAKHKNNLLQIEAMLFGQSGLLNKSFRDEYPQQLKKEYKFLQQKFSLKPIDGSLWKFLRLRPPNFPTIKIAQFAQLIHKSSGLFSLVIECKTMDEIRKMFNLSCSAYWETHYVFDKSSVKRKKTIGEKTIDLIIINTIVPFLFLYGIKKDSMIYKQRALQFLEQITGESNSVIKRWKAAGMKVDNAFNTQALLELKTNYCNLKRCLHCRIGNYLLRK